MSEVNSHKTYTSSQLAAMFHLSANSINNWQANGVIPPCTRTPGGKKRQGHRLYTQAHVDALTNLLKPPAPTVPTAAPPLSETTEAFDVD